MTELPELTGSPIRIYARPKLTAQRGKLLSARVGQGTPVYAASFIRKRKIVLESELFATPRMLRFILTHEIFHFIWIRLGNPARKRFSNLLLHEFQQGARGELGESSGVAKDLLRARRQLLYNSRLWRDYVCESFCDTAAWLYSGAKPNHAKPHQSLALARRWRNRRKEWFEAAAQSGWKC